AFGFAQKADDLLVSKTFLHVQSPRGRELDSKLRRYSKLGGRRRHNGKVRRLSQLYRALLDHFDTMHDFFLFFWRS
ncbi:hypothetical protein, partial [Xanthomonas campestris]|uniref:hypothetical protein n=1 Tax=Xanthomonas campestris TaxID=339 RepID=UPI0039C1B11F